MGDTEGWWFPHSLLGPTLNPRRSDRLGKEVGGGGECPAKSPAPKSRRSSFAGIQHLSTATRSPSQGHHGRHPPPPTEKVQSTQSTQSTQSARNPHTHTSSGAARRRCYSCSTASKGSPMQRGRCTREGNTGARERERV